ncbi:DJ-1/PfpI family protein [Nakamurella endophytica]|uniref:DJ-1/PfpI domain-containing protein n=1 Tax=Nakamurella endophytica TaxID=1748367 RepID=A0A917T6S7_9ACTN|nr:hypothetical protein GCM10011594_34140 [Nakamurella endophytica]
MAGGLTGRQAALLAADRVQRRARVERVQPRRALDGVGTGTPFFSIHPGHISPDDPDPEGADTCAVDGSIDVSPVDVDAVVLPGCTVDTGRPRGKPAVVRSVRDLVARKPVASMCHGRRTPMGADPVREGRLMSWPGGRTGLVTTGAVVGIPRPGRHPAVSGGSGRRPVCTTGSGPAAGGTLRPSCRRPSPPRPATAAGCGSAGSSGIRGRTGRAADPRWPRP